MFERFFIKDLASEQIPDDIRQERLASLSNDPVLKELLDASSRMKILEALELLSARKFEEAFASVRASEVPLELLSGLEENKKNVELSKKKVERKSNSTLRY